MLELVVIVRESGKVLQQLQLVLHSGYIPVITGTMLASALGSGTEALKLSNAPPLAPIGEAAMTLEQLLVVHEAALRLKGNQDESINECLKLVRRAATHQGWRWARDITPDSLTAFLTARRAAGDSAKYVNAQRAAVFGVCKLAVQRGLLERNPVEEVPLAKVEKRRHRVVPTQEEVGRLILAAASDWRKRDRWLVYLVAASTGLRMSTLRRLRWEHVHIGEGLPFLDLDGKIVKNGEQTHVWLTKECERHLLAHRGPRTTGPVFSGVPMKSEHFDRDIAKAGLAKKVGEASLSAHSLRHFAINRMRFAQPFSDEERKSQAGHKVLSMTTRVYCEPALVELGRRIYLMPPILPENHNGPEPWHLRGGEHGDKSPRKAPPFDMGGKDGVMSARRGHARNEARLPPSQPTGPPGIDLDHRFALACPPGEPLVCDEIPGEHAGRQAGVGSITQNGGDGSNPVTPTCGENNPDSPQGGRGQRTGLLVLIAAKIDADANLIARLLLDKERQDAGDHSSHG